MNRRAGDRPLRRGAHDRVRCAAGGARRGCRRTLGAPPCSAAPWWAPARAPGARHAGAPGARDRDLRRAQRAWRWRPAWRPARGSSRVRSIGSARRVRARALRGGRARADRIELRLGPALETIESLDGPFDLVFIDADKSDYLAYYEAVLPEALGARADRRRQHAALRDDPRVLAGAPVPRRSRWPASTITSPATRARSA